MPKKQDFLELDIQFFSEPGGTPTDPAGNPGGQEPPATPSTPPANPEPSGGQDPKEPPADPKPQDKMLPQSEVNNLIAREAKKAQEKLLKQLGVKDFDSAKEGLDKFKEWQDEQKTEAQKLAERVQGLETEHQTVAEENAQLKAQLSAVSAGVDSEFVEDVIVLANKYVTEDVTIDQAIEQVLEKYPHFKGEGTNPSGDPVDPPAPQFSTGQHQKKVETELDQWINAFK